MSDNIKKQNNDCTGLLAACLFAKCSGAPENITFAGNECFDVSFFFLYPIDDFDYFLFLKGTSFL